MQSICFLSLFFFVRSVFRRISSRSSVPPELQGLIVDNLHVFTSLRALKTPSGWPSAALYKLGLSGVTTLLSCLSDYTTTKIIIKRQGSFPRAMVMGRIDRCRKISLKMRRNHWILLECTAKGVIQRCYYCLGLSDVALFGLCLFLGFSNWKKRIFLRDIRVFPRVPFD